MDFNPDENRFRDRGEEDDSEDSAPEEFRPRPAAAYIDILSIPSWQHDTSPLQHVPESSGAGSAATANGALTASSGAAAPTATDPLQSAHPLDHSDNEGASEDESEEEGADAKAKGNGTPTESTPTVKFPVDLEINNRIALWLGNITKMKCDAVVNSTNESMTSRTGVAGKIIDAAGPDLIAELPTVDPCKTGECRVTKGFNLPASWILHTVGPRYNDKYITAAENALHNCYRTCLETAVENRLKTIAMTVVHSTRRGYPSELGAHIAVRTVRRFMERWGRPSVEKGVSRVVFVFDSQESFDVYRRILPLYFPRNEAELTHALAHLPADTGNEYGETVVQERTIRIGAFPSAGPSSSSSSSSSQGPSNGITSANDRPVSSESDRNALSGLMAMHGDKDAERRRRLATLTPEQIQQQQLYINYLQLAHRTDLKEVEKLNILYQSGTDASGRPIIIFCAMRLPEENQALLDKIFLYYIKTMDVIANNDYVLIYAHTNMGSKSKPDFSWLKKVYNIFDDKYGDHMHQLYVLHPTFWLKFVETFFSTFASSKIFTKLKYIDRVVDLYDIFGRDQIKLPQEIMQYDQAENGSIDVQTRASGRSSDKL